jgi:hypothetical protein
MAADFPAMVTLKTLVERGPETLVLAERHRTGEGRVS